MFASQGSIHEDSQDKIEGRNPKKFTSKGTMFTNLLLKKNFAPRERKGKVPVSEGGGKKTGLKLSLQGRKCYWGVRRRKRYETGKKKTVQAVWGGGGEEMVFVGEYSANRHAEK